MFQIIAVLAVVALLLWALSQFPLDPTIVKLIRVVVIVAVCLWLISLLFGGGFGNLGSGFTGLSRPCGK